MAAIDPARKVLLAGRIWVRLGVVWWTFRRRPLPEAVLRIGTALPAREVDRLAPRRLGSIVFRVLRIGPWRPRCLYRAAVLHSLLRGRGDTSELVIGLSTHARSKDAHAWVEVDGHDAGPPPGRGAHEELARYP